VTLVTKYPFNNVVVLRYHHFNTPIILFPPIDLIVMINVFIFN